MRILFREPKRIGSNTAIFLDRDGVINRRKIDGYVLDWSEFVFIPGIREALKQLATLDLPTILISNQAAVGKCLLDAARLEQITEQMQKALLFDGAPLTAAYYCTHRREENCPCRKPKPGLLRRAAEDFDIDLRRSIFIGDSESDLEAGEAAGCRPILFGRSLDASLAAIRPSLATATDASKLFEVARRCLEHIVEA
jgi:D-glycero-D-manno-heptose 1,7-bisphosphate phosphatase